MFCADAALKFGRPFVDERLNGRQQGGILCRRGDIKVEVAVTYKGK